MSTQRRLLWSIGITALVLFTSMQFILAGLVPNIVSLQLSFTPDTFRKVLNAWQQSGIDAYRSHFPYDFAFLICYGSFGYLLATSTPVFSRFTNKFAAQLRWLLPVAAFFDAVENIAHLRMLDSDAAITPIAVALSGTSSLLKWLMTITFVIALGTAFVLRRR